MLDPSATNAVADIAGTGGIDLALEFVGRPQTVLSAVRSLDVGGRAVAVGIGQGQVVASHLMTLVVRERELIGAYGNEPDEVRAGLDCVHRGDTGGSRIVLDIAG
jgi:D-arabinose 1-dehydrogenase-like Zn-dependent alcohol dehydrogenase